MLTRKQMIKFIAMVVNKTQEDVELYYFGKSLDYVKTQFDKYQSLAEQNDTDFAAA